MTRKISEKQSIWIVLGVAGALLATGVALLYFKINEYVSYLIIGSSLGLIGIHMAGDKALAKTVPVSATGDAGESEVPIDPWTSLWNRLGISLAGMIVMALVVAVLGLGSKKWFQVGEGFDRDLIKIETFPETKEWHAYDINLKPVKLTLKYGSQNLETISERPLDQSILNAVSDSTYDPKNPKNFVRLIDDLAAMCPTLDKDLVLSDRISKQENFLKQFPQIKELRRRASNGEAPFEQQLLKVDIALSRKGSRAFPTFLQRKTIAFYRNLDDGVPQVSLKASETDIPIGSDGEGFTPALIHLNKGDMALIFGEGDVRQGKRSIYISLGLR